MTSSPRARIQRVEIFPLEARLTEPFGWSQRWTGARATTAVRIHTSDGVHGWGESSNAPSMRALAPLLIGEDASQPEAVWQKLYRAGYQAHNYAGPNMDAISAFDMALWDIAGKLAGKPVFELLGGRVRDRVAVYATGLYYREDDFPGKLLDEAAGYAEAGFTGMKMKIGGKSVDDDATRVYRLREAIGPDLKLMVDANEGYNLRTASIMAKRLEGANLAWFEEPCGSYDDQANRRLCEVSNIPISGGESLRARYEFAGRLATGVFDVIQPDIVHVGGVSELHKVGHMANAFRIPMHPHFWGTGISLAATLHVMTTMPLNPPAVHVAPYVNEPVMEFDRTPHPIRETLTDPVFDQQDSSIAVPTSAGLGVEVQGEVLDRFLVGEPTIVTRST